jgi:stationary-phase-induced ribosome-associated protein
MFSIVQGNGSRMTVAQRVKPRTVPEYSLYVLLFYAEWSTIKHADEHSSCPKGCISTGNAGVGLETIHRNKGVTMKSNRQARHILGLNYKLSNQKKVLIEGDSATEVNHTHATGRKRRG